MPTGYDLGWDAPFETDRDAAVDDDAARLRGTGTSCRIWQRRTWWATACQPVWESRSHTGVPTWGRLPSVIGPPIAVDRSTTSTATVRHSWLLGLAVVGVEWRQMLLAAPRSW